MKRGLTIGLAIAAAGITYSYVSARSFKSEPALYVAADTLAREPARVAVKPPSEIVDTVREMGLIPNSEVLRRGPYYVLHALDAQGVEQRVVADAHFGDILLVRPAQPYSLAPDYVRAPRIIHVPQPDDTQSNIDGDRGALGRGDDAVRRIAPPPHRGIEKRPRHRADDLPPSPPRRTVERAPPTDALLTPIRPTPNFGAKTGAGEKFGPPQAAPPPPPGYTPPTAAPGGG